MKQQLFWYHLIITIIFTYVFVQFLTMKRSNIVFKIYADYILNKYCLILYILLSLIIMKYDTYTGILLLLLIIGPFKISLKEYFYEDPPTSISPSTPTNTLIDVDVDVTNKDVPTIIKNNVIVADIPIPTVTSLQGTVDSQKLINIQNLGIDDRFKVDDVAVKDILRQIKSQVDFDPYKTNLSKEVIYEIYNKYFDNDVFVKLKNNNDDSATYLAAGNFNYVPTVPQVDYDLVTYQNLNNNLQVGINPLIDGIANKTKINRG
jgi:hypothetical protein